MLYEGLPLRCSGASSDVLYEAASLAQLVWRRRYYGAKGDSLEGNTTGFDGSLRTSC